MSLELVFGIGLIVTPFVIFALALAYGDYQYHRRK